MKEKKWRWLENEKWMFQNKWILKKDVSENWKAENKKI